MMHQDSLEPDLCSKAYRSLPGDQDIFSQPFSCIYVYPQEPQKVTYYLEVYNMGGG